MSAHSSRARARRRADILYAAIAALGLVALAWTVITIQELGHELQTANEARDALARQVETLGHKPVAGPPGSRGEPGKSVVGPRGPQGQPGEPGSPGPSGAPGKNGSNGNNGVDGTPGAPGPSGAPGANGSNGADGPAGPQGPQGEPGPAGPQGPAGKDGADGKDGQTCPDGYSLQHPSYDPDALVCRKDGAPQPSPGNGNGGLLSAGLDPSRRQYI